MQTSCGSPRYANPELITSEGAIWPCGVIFYAMLAGYLPFGDNPANPDSDNISLLYKYIAIAPLSFFDYISHEAGDLLSIMLQPDSQLHVNLGLVTMLIRKKRNKLVSPSQTPWSPRRPIVMQHRVSEVILVCLSSSDEHDLQPIS
jgi:serine/threonine protein kinase